MLRPGTERELKVLFARNPDADHYSLYWVTNCLYVGGIRNGVTQAPARVEMSAEAFISRCAYETNWMTYVAVDETLVIVGTTGRLAWFDRNVTNMPTELIKKIRPQPGAPGYRR